MAASMENLLSLGQLTSTERNTFTKQRDHSVKQSVNRPVLSHADISNFQSYKHSRVMQLQQRWQELKERELKAQQHNRELLQQFEKAQDTLKEMLARSAAMKTIRLEYERYLEESTPRWQQQLKEKTQAQRTRMEDCLWKNMEEERATKPFADQHKNTQGSTKKPQDVAATREHNSPDNRSEYNYDGYSNPAYIQSSWLTHPQSQTVKFPARVYYQPQSSSHAPPSFLPHPHPFMLHQPAFLPTHHHPWPRQDAPVWSSRQTDCPWPWTAGGTGLPSGSEALWGQLYTEEPPPESRGSHIVAQEVEASRAASFKSELDIKPVRLSSGYTESSESGRDSSQVIREKRKRKEKRGRSQSNSSDQETHRSQQSSSAVIITSAAVVQSSESDASSVRGGTKTRRRSGGQVVPSPKTEKMTTERAESKGDDSGSQKEVSHCDGEESENHTEESSSENARNQSVYDKSEKCGEESGGISIQLKNVGGGEKEKQESRSSEQSSAEENDEDEEGHEADVGGEDSNAVEKENSQNDAGWNEEGDVEDPEENKNSLKEEDQEEKYEEEHDQEAFARKTSKEEEETEAEDDMKKDEDELEDEDCEKRSASFQDGEVEEVESEQDEDETEEDEDGSAEGEEEEQKSDKAGELEQESSSEDSIISPQENRMHIIPEEADEEDDDDKGSKTESCDGDDSNEFSEEDDIENLLAPQQKKKEEKDLKTDEKPTAVCDNMKIFQVEDEISTKTDHQSDSDEFDHFYD